MSFEVLPNTSMNASSGAGIGAAQLIAERGVEAVLTGAVGPNATVVLSQTGIKMVTGAQGSVRQAVEAFKSGSLKPETPVGYGRESFNRGPGTNLGWGMRRGMGRGMGMGPGRSTGMGRGAMAPPSAAAPSGSREDEIAALGEVAAELRRQLAEVMDRLDRLEKGE